MHFNCRNIRRCRCKCYCIVENLRLIKSNETRPRFFFFNCRGLFNFLKISFPAQTGKQERVTTERCFKHFRACVVRLVFVLKSRVNARKEPLTISLFRAKGEDLNSKRTLAEKNELAQITAARDPAYSGLFNQAFFSRLFPRPRQNSYIRRCVFYSEVHLSTSSPIVCRSHDAANL